MSFILDALRKSETERQQQGAAEFVSIASSSGSRSGPRWLWIIGILLAINLAVLLGLLFRSDDSAIPQVTTQQPAKAIAAEVANETSFANQVAAAQQDRQRKLAALETPEAPPDNEENSASTNAVVAEIIAGNPDFEQSSEIYPTIFAVRAKGAISIPDLHLDIHVYSDVPEDRFVFINMSKHREGSQLEEGPIVDKITPDGVVLGHRGIRFLLPRD